MTYLIFWLGCLLALAFVALNLLIEFVLYREERKRNDKDQK